MAARVWYQDVAILWKKPLEFFPARRMSLAEQTNALTRLTIYITLASVVYNGDVRTVYFGLVVLAILALMYRGRGGSWAGRDRLAPVACRPSTADNPFANTLVSEYNTETQLLKPCSTAEIADDARTNFNDGLPRDADDIWEKNNSQRQFFSMPDGGFPDTGAYRDYLYGGARNCKTHAEQCTGFDG
jgi:hypothetical protein